MSFVDAGQSFTGGRAPEINCFHTLKNSMAILRWLLKHTHISDKQPQRNVGQKIGNKNLLTTMNHHHRHHHHY